MSPQYVLKADNINIFYGDTHAVKDVSMNLKRNHVTAIIGPSGCGKSSLLRSFNRMHDLVEEAKVSGSLLFEEQDLLQIDPIEVRSKIGMVFQRPNPFPMTIAQNVTWGPKIHGVPKSEYPRIIEESLRKAALWDEVKERLDSPALKLSGGQQQRLCIARAIAMKPEILLMDEPCSALDPKSTHKIEELIEELSSDYTIVIVTHNMQQAARVSHETAFFYEGHLVEMNDTKYIFNESSNKLTADYIGGHFG